MISVEQLTGHDLRALKEVLGRPFTAALEDGDTDAIYAFVWISDRRDNPELTFDTVLERDFGDVVAAFTEANEAGVDPTNARSGGTSQSSATSGE